MWCSAFALSLCLECQRSEFLLLPLFRSPSIRKDMKLRFCTSHLCMDFQRCEVSLPHFQFDLIAKDLKFCFFHTSALSGWIYDSAQLMSAWSSKDVKFRVRISTQPSLPKILSSAFSTLPPCLHSQRYKVMPPNFCSALTAVYSYMYFHTCLTWKISPSERRGILIRTQKPKPSSNWFYCWSSSKDFYMYPIRSVKVWCGEHVESTYKDTDVLCQWLSIKNTRSYMFTKRLPYNGLTVYWIWRSTEFQCFTLKFQYFPCYVIFSQQSGHCTCKNIDDM